VEAFYKDWSRDGKYVYFNVHLDKEPAIYRVRISDHKVERVLDLKELSPANQWFGLAPDDSILVARDISSQSIYSMDVELP
jgi:Tol biopolymer transport system component